MSRPNPLDAFMSKIRENARAHSAFEYLCARGCTRNLLAGHLLILSVFPLRKGKKRYTAVSLRALDRIAMKVGKTANALERLVAKFAPDPSFQEFYYWKGPVAAPAALRNVAMVLKKSTKSVRSAYRTQNYSHFLYRTPGAYEHIPVVVKYIRDRTGKPAYERLADVIAVALDNSLSAQEIKMICKRRASRS
jgi:hypothetical protein